MGTPHRIRRQHWRVRAGSAEEAFALRRELRDACDGVLQDALERAFDRALPDDRVVRLSRLEVRLRVGSLAELADLLPSAVAEAVEREMVAAPPSPARPGRREGVRSGSVRENALATLLHFLRAGTLPWADAGRSADEVRRELRDAAREAPERVAEAARGAAAPEIFWLRLLALLEPAGAPSVVEALSAALPAPWRSLLARLVEPTPSLAAAGVEGWRRHVRLRLAALLLAAAGDGGDAGADAAALGAALDSALAAAGGAAGGAEEVLDEEIREEVGALRAALSGRTGRRRAPGTPPVMVVGQAAGMPAASSTSQVPSDLPAPPVAEVDVTDEAEEIDALGLMVPNAGLVLLHPYLRPLLEHTGLAVAGRVAGPALPRAAALLHHLATGREEVQEFELGLVKVLLGLAPDSPLPVTEGLLLPDDLAESESLLRAAIEHWGVLKSTTPAGLRSAFLARRGLLRREAGGWRLRVETAPYDMLLDRLPWSIGVVKLPWMNEPLYTEWPTP